MYLKKVEMKGFKSFADKTEINFESGISCIIGPNGSGKSNITDALRWVLGEQKVSLLRGTNMKDVIFKGTEHRKPLGRAEISLYFDNKNKFFSLDYDEVKITRRLFMSGESEYLINDTKIRLKDVRELIMDTGIGTEGYSIIGQGKINTMITANKEDIRLIFEEASGITKFKTRKKESQRKLERTTINLDRIEDIVFELEKRIEPLRKESEKAIEYKENYETLKNIELSTYSKKLNNSSNIEKLYNKKITDLYILKDHKTNYVNSIKKNIEKLKEDINSKSNEYKNKERNYYDFNEKISSAVNNLNINKERIENTNKNIIEIDIELKILKKKIENLKKIENEFKNKEKNVVKEINEKNKILTEEIQKLQNNIEIADKKISENFKVNKELLEFDKQKERNFSTIESRKENIIQIKALINDYETEMEIISDGNSINVNDRDKINEELNDLNNKEIKETNIKNEILKNLSNSQIELENSNKNHFDIKGNLNKLVSEHKLLKTYEENFVGYFHSVKELMTSIKNTDLNSGVHGVVGSLINMKNEYEVAIEITLGSAMQNIVCDDAGVAKKLINHLKKNKFGRVSFLPLSSLFERKDDERVMKKVKEFENFIGKADEIITCDKKYKSLFNHLLGNVLVVKDYDTAREILKIKNIRYKIVTLDGENFTPGGRITGGSYTSKSKGLIGRKRKIEKIALEIEEKTELKEELEIKINELNREVYSKKENLVIIEGNLSKLKNSGFELKSKLNYFNEKLNDFNEKIDKLEKIKSESFNKIDLINENIESLKSSNLEIEVKVNELNNILKENNIVDELNVEIELNKSVISDIKVEIASLNEKLNNYKYNENNSKIEIDEIDSSISLKEDLFKKFSESIEKQKELSEKLEIDIEKFNLNKVNLKNTLEIFEKNIINEEEKLRTIELQKEEINGKLRTINEKLLSYQLEKAKLNILIKNIKEDLWQKYEMSYLEILEYDYNENLVIDSDKKLNQLRRKIKKIGNVNLSSIEEYSEVKERYEYLNKQQNDLNEAKRSLDKIIKDMDKKMKKQFMSELVSIKENFKEVFKVLFNGGEADVIIDDPNDVLESEIKIMAQPPGKKLQGLDLLSGGEKALTAISLLFAILKNKPTPFCVLDEIEAALDDVNVFRFADYLKSIAGNSQFIVITHRKGTMEIADSLYGVTMEEKGISKIVSLKLENIEKEMV